MIDELMRVLQTVIGTFAMLAALLNFPPAAKSSVTPVPNEVETHSVTVMTYNIYWKRTEEERMKSVAENIIFYSPDVVGTQEATNEHLTNLKKYLPEYAYVGVPRDDGISQGEYAAIFYKTAKYELIKSGTFWLSKTPDIPSLDWHADEYRICTYVVLNEKSSGFEFAVFNTHFDQRSVFARNHSAEIITKKAKEFAPNLPVFLTGDFNAEQTTAAYAKIIKAGYADSKFVADFTTDGCTFNDWLEEENDWNWQNAIDHIFVSDRIHADSYDIGYRKINGEYPSDHFPVIVKARMF